MKKKDTIIFILLNGFASFINFAIYPALARILNDKEFVSTTVTLALFTQLSSFMLSVVALTIGLSKQKSEKDAKELTEKLQAILTHLFIVIILLFLVFSPLVLKATQLSSLMLIPIVSMLALSISMSIITGYLNGKQKLIKLGYAVLFSALLQLFFSVFAALITKSGVFSLIGMAFGSFISIIIIYNIFKSENLPHPSTILIHKLNIYKSQKMKALIKYTVVASIATLVLNILMIADLLIINNRQADSAIYANIYVVSRIVFFGGMLFIWPFLSAIDVVKRSNNYKNFALLTCILLTIAGMSVLGIQVFGKQVFELILGVSYPNIETVKTLSILSILYKIIFLIITFIYLYFIVLRSYWVLTLTLVLLSTIGLFLILINESYSTLKIISTINIVSLPGLLVAIIGFIDLTRKKLLSH